MIRRIIQEKIPSLRTAMNHRRLFATSSTSSTQQSSTTNNNNNNNNNNNKKKKDIPLVFSGPQRTMMELERPNPAQGKHEDELNLEEGEAFFAQQRTMVDRILYAPVAASERRLREDLCVAHRLMARYNYDDLVWNHISARCGASSSVDGASDEDGEECCDINPNTYLITPGGLHFSEVRPQDLVFDSVEESGNIFHSGIYSVRKDVKAIIHAHTPAVMAVGVLEEGFVHLTQDSAAFYNKIGYHDWEGLHTSDEEKQRVAKNLGNGDILFLRNHGAVVVGRSIQEAFVKYYYLERCCRVQIDAMSTGRKVRPMPNDMLEHAAKQVDAFFPHGKYEWRALTRLVQPKN